MAINSNWKYYNQTANSPYSAYGYDDQYDSMRNVAGSPLMSKLQKAQQEYDMAAMQYRAAGRMYDEAKRGEQAFCPPQHEIDSNPALKIAYEEFMIIYKLQKGPK